MKSLGKHAIVELYDCDKACLDNIDLIKQVLVNAVERSGATVIKPFFHRFSPFGVSGIVVIAESHFSIHTWPEYQYAAVDIFTCGDIIDNGIAIKHIKEGLKAGKCSVTEIKRGIFNFPVLLHKPEC